MAYLDHTHPDAFLDHAKLKPEYGLNHLCTKCHGYGGWNLALNQYKLPPGFDDTPENRNRFVHFRTICNVCNGHGYTLYENPCDHKLVLTRNLGRCWNQYKCTECGAYTEIDSSD